MGGGGAAMGEGNITLGEVLTSCENISLNTTHV